MLVCCVIVIILNKYYINFLDIQENKNDSYTMGQDSDHRSRILYLIGILMIYLFGVITIFKLLFCLAKL